MSGRELLLRLIASWGGFGWERIRERYEQSAASPEALLARLCGDGLVHASAGGLVLTKAGQDVLSVYNRARAEDAAQRGGIAAAALIGLVKAMQPVACELFEGIDARWEAVSVALDVAATIIGVDLNPRTDDGVSWPEPGTPEPTLPESITHGWPGDT